MEKTNRFAALSIIFLVLMFLTWGFNIFMSEEKLVSFVSDDAFYYLQVVENIINGKGSTFDGINPTNGYHPLWMVILVMFRAILAPLATGDFLRVTLLLQAILALGVVGMLWVALKRYVSHYALFAGLLLFSISFFSPITGLETALTSFGIAFAFWAISTNRSVVWVSIALAWITLSRLDFTLVAGCLGIAWVWSRPEFSLKTALSLILKVYMIPIALGLLYMLLNQSIFGYPLPVTFVIKTGSSISLVENIKNAFSAYSSRAVFAPVLLMPLVFLGYDLVRKNPISAFNRIVLLLALGSLAHISYMFLTVGFGAARWHFIPHGVSYAIALAWLVETIYLRTTWGKIKLLYAGLIIGIGFISLATNARVITLINEPPETNPSVQLYRTALWIRENTPVNSVIGLKDAGIVGYFSDRSVINLDGLINSFEAYQAMRDGTLCEKMEAWQVSYFARACYALFKMSLLY